MAAPRTLSEISSSFTTALAAVSSAALFLSILHELVYYAIVGMKFLALLDTTDYIKQALYWLPIVIGMSIVQTVPYAVGLDYPRKVVIDAVDDHFTNRVHRSLSLFRLALTIGVPLGLAAAALIMITTEGLIGAVLIAIPASLPISLIIIRVLGVRAFSLPGIGIFNAVGVFCLSIGMGLSEASVGLTRDEANFEVRLSDPDEVRKVVILRLFGRGALIRNPDGKTIEFVPTDRIKSISTTR